MDLQEIKERVAEIKESDWTREKILLRMVLYRDLLKTIRGACVSHGVEIAIDEALKAEDGEVG